MHTSAVFESAGKLKSVVTAPCRNPQQAKGFPMMQDMREEFVKGDQAAGGQLDPMVNALK